MSPKVKKILLSHYCTGNSTWSQVLLLLRRKITSRVCIVSLLAFVGSESECECLKWLPAHKVKNLIDRFSHLAAPHQCFTTSRFTSPFQWIDGQIDGSILYNEDNNTNCSYCTNSNTSMSVPRIILSAIFLFLQREVP